MLCSQRSRVTLFLNTFLFTNDPAASASSANKHTQGHHEDDRTASYTRYGRLVHMPALGPRPLGSVEWAHDALGASDGLDGMPTSAVLIFRGVKRDYRTQSGPYAGTVNGVLCATRLRPCSVYSTAEFTERRPGRNP